MFLGVAPSIYSILAADPEDVAIVNMVISFIVWLVELILSS